MYTTRHLERRETLAHWPARQAVFGKLVGLVSDMSTEGINIHSNHVFNKGQQLSLRVSVDSSLCGQDHLCLQVKNVWCQETEEPGMYHAGFKIVVLPEQTKMCMERLMKGFSYPAPNQRLVEIFEKTEEHDNRDVG